MTLARPTLQTGQAQGAGRRGDAQARIKRSAWLLGGLAILFYLGYIAYYFLRAGA